MTRALIARKGLVYFIEAVGADRVKIGFTSGDPARRAQKLQTACPFPLRVLASYPGSTVDEAALHERFAAARAVPATEWFHLTSEIRSHIAIAGRGVGERVGRDAA